MTPSLSFKRVPTAGHQARSGGTAYIFSARALPARRRSRLSSRFRPHTNTRVVTLSTVVFETSRLIARHIDPSDANAMLAVYGSTETTRFVGDGKPLNLQSCEGWIQVILERYMKYGYGMSALTLRSSGEVVGFCGLVHPHYQIEAEIKYAFRQAFWGKGLATEAVAAMLKCARDDFRLAEVIATVNPMNAASQKVLLNAGMKKGDLRPNPDGSFTQMFSWTANVAQPPSS